MLGLPMTWVWGSFAPLLFVRAPNQSCDVTATSLLEPTVLPQYTVAASTVAHMDHSHMDHGDHGMPGMPGMDDGPKCSMNVRLARSRALQTLDQTSLANETW